MSEFTDKYIFKEGFSNCLGAEEEFWVVNPRTGLLTDTTVQLFTHMREGHLKPELPVQQIESNSKICRFPEELEKSLQKNRDELEMLGRKFNFHLNTNPMPPGKFDFQVFPKLRFEQLAREVSQELLLKCWTNGLHIHVGCSSLEEAMMLLNDLRDDLPYFLAASARSPSPIEAENRFMSERYLRFESYYKDVVPPYLLNRDHFELIAKQSGFVHDPRRCGWGVRINPQGTVEVRVFDTQETAEQSAEMATLVFARALLYKEGFIKSGKMPEEVKSEMIIAAKFGPKLTSLKQWVVTTRNLLRNHMELDFHYFDTLLERLNFR